MDAQTISFSGLPLDFRLSDENHEPVLHLDAATGHAMELAIGNTSRDALVLTPFAGMANADNHHFALRFRAGVLFGDSHDRVAVAGADRAAWSAKTRKHDNGDVSIYLLHGQKVECAPGEALRVTLEGLRGDRARGTRGTRVELGYRSLTYTSDPQTELRGRRTHALVLTSLRSEGRSRLEIDFCGPSGNMVVSDGGSSNRLSLRLRSTGAGPVQLGSRGSMLLSLVTSDDRQSSTALCTNDDLPEGSRDNLLKAVYLSDGQQRELVVERVRGKPSWTITNNDSQALSIDGSRHIEITLPVFSTHHVPGLTNLSLQIRQADADQPDERLVAALQKVPVSPFWVWTLQDKLEQTVGELRQVKTEVCSALRLAVQVSLKGDFTYSKRAALSNGQPVAIIRASAYSFFWPGPNPRWIRVSLGVQEQFELHSAAQVVELFTAQHPSWLLVNNEPASPYRVLAGTWSPGGVIDAFGVFRRWQDLPEEP